MNLFFYTQRVIFLCLFITSTLHATQKLTKEQQEQKKAIGFSEKNPLLVHHFPLKTGDITIREVKISDAKQLYDKINEALEKDKNFYKYYEPAKNWAVSIEGNKRMIPMMNKIYSLVKEFYIINLLVCKGDKEIIGCIEIQKINSAFLGYYRIDTQAPKDGIMTKAIAHITHFLLKNVFHTVYLEIQPDNKKSIRLARNIGFKIAKNHNHKSSYESEKSLFFEKKAKVSKL